MSEKHLNIISFDVPFPPNYGGVIDVFYKIKGLSQKGCKIHLHCFTGGRKPTPLLEKWCETVNYYSRNSGLLSLVSKTPYIVQSRSEKKLLKNLRGNAYPILFEGLHSCAFLDHPDLENRQKIVRMANIEQDYYRNLAKAEHHPGRKAFFLIEAMKLKPYEKVLRHADLILAISEKDENHLRKKFGAEKVKLMPPFHENKEVISLVGKGSYALYHGNLSVPENIVAAGFIIDLFRDLKFPLKIAGLHPPEKIISRAGALKNVELIANPKQDRLNDLIKNAHINLLVTFQETGIKLKLLNVLCKGRFCLVNKHMLAGTGLEELCHIAEKEYLKDKVIELFEKEFSSADIDLRRKILSRRFDTRKNAEELLRLVKKV